MRVARAGAAKPVHTPSPQVKLSTELPTSSEVLVYAA